MQKPIEWLPNQLALAVYAHLYGIDDLGFPESEILRLAGLSQGQWTARITIDFPAQEGTSRSETRVVSWYEDYVRFKRMARHDLQNLCVRYLANMRGRKGSGGAPLGGFQDWQGRDVEVVRSRGGVLALANLADQLIKPDGIPWPPAPVVQKLYESRQIAAFDSQAQQVLTSRLGYYSDLQSVHSEDAMTWNYFGPLLAAPPAERLRFGNWLLLQLQPQAEPNRVCEIDLWRRIPHPETRVPGGPEIDFVVTGDQCVILGEAKWRSAEGKGQGLNGDKTQLQLRSEFLHQYGQKIYGGRRFYLLLVTLDREGASPSDSPELNRLTWADLCAYPHHPMHAEVNDYYRWKREHSL